VDGFLDANRSDRTIVIVNSRFLKSPQNLSRGSQVIHTRLHKHNH